MFPNEKFFAAVGRVAYQSSFLELEVANLIEEMLRGDGAICVTADLSFAGRYHLACALARRLIWSDRDLVWLIGLLDKAKLAQENRNVILHGVWMQNEFDRRRLHPIQFRARGTFKMQTDVYSIRKILRVAKTLAKIADKISEFSQRGRFKSRVMFSAAKRAQRAALKPQSAARARSHTPHRSNKALRGKLARPPRSSEV